MKFVFASSSLFDHHRISMHTGAEIEQDGIVPEQYAECLYCIQSYLTCIASTTQNKRLLGALKLWLVNRGRSKSSISYLEVFDEIFENVCSESVCGKGFEAVRRHHLIIIILSLASATSRHHNILPTILSVGLTNFFPLTRHLYDFNLTTTHHGPLSPTLFSQKISNPLERPRSFFSFFRNDSISHPLTTIALIYLFHTYQKQADRFDSLMLLSRYLSSTAVANSILHNR